MCVCVSAHIAHVRARALGECVDMRAHVYEYVCMYALIAKHAYTYACLLPARFHVCGAYSHSFSCVCMSSCV